MSRHARIAATLQGIVGRVLRIEPRDLDIEAPFLELGADSLALVEALRGLQETFGVKLTIRQLFEQLPTISALAGFLEQTLPAETPGSAGVPPAPHPPAPSPIAPPSAGRGGEQLPSEKAPANADSAFRGAVGPKARASLAQGNALGREDSGPGLDRVFGMQIQAFNQLVAQQLQMLGGRPASAPSAPAAAPVLPAFVGKAGGRPAAEMDERQRRHVEALVERYCRKTAKSKELTQKYRPWLADSRATVGFRMQTKEMLYPLARARSQGSRLWDLDGNEYVDVTMGMGVHLFGHDPDFLRGTLEEQVRAGFELGPRSAHSGEVAALFCELTGMERATFTNSGTEACMTAIRLARARTGRTRIVMFAGSYHGHSDGTLAQTQEVDGELRSFPVAPGIPPKVAEDVLVLDYGTPEALEVIRRHRNELAAVIVEPIQSRRPDLQPRDFLHELRALTAESGIALIFDEMICGFRLHLGGAQAWFGVRADIATYGKVVGGGLPIGVVAGSAEFMDGIDGGMWSFGDDSRPERDTTFFGGTFCQHPLAMAAARRVLTYLKEQGPGLQETLNARTARFAARLNGWLGAEGVPISVKSAHSLFRFAMTGNTELLYYHLVDKGVYVWEWRNCFLSTAHTDADLDFVVEAVQESVAELRRGGFLPEKPSGGPSGFWERQGKPAIAPVAAGQEIRGSQDSRDGVDFSLYFFGHYAAEFQAGKYDLMLDCARFADRNGFSGLWFPERHFHAFGGISPNPSVLAAALARETERIALRAGSVVLPLHHPMRVAEEWALVDNLSGGRVGLSYASGWHPNDFALAPESYGRHRELMIERAAIVEKLWRGEALRTIDGAGTEVDLKVYPLPARRDLPIWITIVNNPETYRLAGEMGAGVLTNLMGQTVEGLAAHLEIYREALARAGHPPSAGHVTLLLHTFVGPDAEAAIATARRPFYSYLESSVGLLRNMLASEGMPVDWDRLSRDDLDYMLELAYQRYVKTSALIGSPETCAPIVERLRGIGVDEIAGLIDFGVAPDAVRASLPWIAGLKDRFRPRRPAPQATEPIAVPLTEAQHDLWTVVQLGEEASLAYLEAGVLEMRGPLDLPLLRRALQAVVDRHEALRTVFEPGGMRQRVLPVLDLEIPLVDATGCPPERREEVSRQWMEAESRRPFDLEQAPLVRFSVLRIGARLHRLGTWAHHIIADGLSIVLFLKEVLAIYEAGRAGRRAVLPEPYPFREYVAWLAKGGDETAADEAYWRERFVGEVPVFEPPTDFPRPAVRGFRGGRRIRPMDPEVHRALHQAGRRQGATLFISLLAAWTATLHCWTGQDDLVVGGPTARRPLEGGDRLVGHCVDLVPYRSRLEEGGEISFQSYLAAVRATVLDAHDHGAYPLARLLRALSLPHDPSRAPLISAVFNLDPGPGIAKAAGLELAELSRVVTHAKFDVALHVLEAGSDLLLFLDYRSDLFEPATLDRLLASLVTLSEGAAADPSRPLADLPLFSEAERRQLVEGWNRTGADYPRDASLSDLFAAAAARDPEAPAVLWSGLDGEGRMTYAELREKAERLAEELRALGVGPEVPVALEIERSPELVIAMLGVLMAGGAYVPLDPSDPEERRTFLLADSGARVRIGADLTPDPSPIALPSPGRGAPPPQGGEGLAYIIYTSGSTGRPKGVAVPQRAVARLVLNTDYVQLGPGDRIAHVSNTAFDAATFEVWGALLNGAALVVIPREVALSPAAFAAELRRWGISAMFLTTALFNEVAREEPAALGAVRTLLTGGEAASPGRMREVLAVAEPGARLCNVYGPTEGTTFTTWQPLESVPEGRAVPIGRPIANARVWVLDRGLRPVPLGSPGELCIGGDGLARGYWGRPDLTAERFVPNPFEDGGRLYRTGDRVRQRPDGAIEFLGRTDGQVKIRGFRVETGEIEAVLARCPGVREAVVVAQEGEERRLIAYVVAEDFPPLPGEGGEMGEGGQGGEDFRAFLRDRLPEAMIPSAFVLLDAFPLTPSGKVDRRALAQATARPLEAKPERPAAAPRTPVEEILAAVWADVLRDVLSQETIGVQDDFFALGGHSLLAGRVLSRLRGTLGVELSLRDFFRAPTLAGLAELAVAARGVPTVNAAPPLRPLPRGSREGGLPLSFAQERLWLVEKLEPGTPLHGIPLVHRISGPLRPDLLAAAVARLVERQEALRTVFVEAGGAPVQRVVPAEETEASLPLVDLGGLPEAPRRSTAERLAAEASLRPFDLTAGPLRTFLIRLAADEHTLFLNVHHIAGDEWSLEVMARELSELYAAAAAGRKAVLPPLPVQPADFAVWQRGWLRGAALDERLGWWRAHLSGAPAVLDLPSDRAPGAAQTFRGKVERLTVPDRAAAVRRLAREQGATFFLTLFAVFQALLHRLTGATDLLVGTPVAGRDRTELEGLAGFFVNTLVLRTDASGLPTFAQLLARVREEALNAYPHQDLPFAKLVEALAPQRSASRNPLVQVTFSVPDLSSARLALGPDLHDAIAASTTLTSKFDFSLFVGDVDGALEIEAEFATDLFDTATVRGLMGRYALLLESCLAGPETPVESLAWMTAAEQAQLLAGSRTPAVPGAPETVHERVAAWTAREPGRIALVSDEGRMTYGELAERAGTLARRLTSLGLDPEARVGVFLERSPSLIVALLAVLQAGAAYVPLDAEEPAERLEMILEDAGASVVLTGQGLAGSLPDGIAAPRILVDEPWSGAVGEPARATADSLAYVAFTSGSTGRPKGVAVPHGAVVRLVYDPGFAHLEGETFLQAAPVAFDASTLEIWGALANGGQLVLPRPGRLSAWEIAGVIERHQVTSAWLTSALFLQVLEESTGSSLRSLRQLLVGGDVVPAGAVRRCLERVPGLRVIHGYGPTENTTFTTAWTLTDPAAVRSPLPLGRPLAGTDVHVVDPSLRLVPAGVPGELVTGGRGLARGYHGRPDLTAERFVPHPFSAVPGERLYRTGDLVRYGADGVLEFLGRRDAQVKVRGVRIELAEVEGALAACPGVREGAVIVRRRGGGDESLVAFFVARSSPSPEPAALRTALSAVLPPAMLPSVFIELDALPLTASGKLDRRELERAAEVDASDTLTDTSPAPRTPLEEILAGIWAAVLRVERVGVHDDFFLLGGHSLLAAVILSRVRDVLGVELTLRVFFSAPTVARFAARIEEALQDERPEPPPPIARVPRDGRLPLSFAQERLWFLEKLLPGTPIYSLPLAHRLSGPLQPAALAAAFAGLVRRHEALRTVFVEIDGEPFQTIQDNVPPLLLVDLAGLPEARRETEAGRLLESEARRPFELTVGPLVRALLVRTAAEEHAFLIDSHHIVSDGWSADVMARDLSALYFLALHQGRALPELPVQVPDVAAWQRSWLTGEALEHRLAWWRVRLAGCPTVLALPADRPPLPVRSGRGGLVRLPLPGLLEGMRSLAQRQGATPLLLYLAAFQVLLQRWTGQQDLLAGTPVAGRGRSDEGLIGFFVNTLALRAEPPGERTFAELLARVREAALGAFEHQDLPFEKLVEALVPERDLSRNPLVQVVFSAPDLTASRLDLGPDLRTSVTGVWTGTAKLDLSVAVEAREEGLAAAAEYDADRFERVTIERLLGHYQTLLAACVAEPETAVDDLPWLSETEIHQLVVDWNRTAADYPRDTPLQEIFLDVAVRNPEAPAVVWSGPGGVEALSYGHLHDRAEALARELRALGVGPEALVALEMERSPELIIAMLGVLMAGGAYLPLDPSDPEERRAFLLEDSGARVRIGADLTPDPSPIALPSPGRGAPPPGTEHLAYVIYTSGSTGRPKGVAVPHRAVARLVLGTNFVRIGPDDRVAHMSNTAFDAATLEVWGALLNGAALVVIPREAVLATARLAQEFRRHGVTHGILTAVVFNEIVREAPDLLRGGSLRYVFTGGEAASPGHVREALALAHPGLLVTNAYGPTESTCIALTHRVEAVPLGADVPIGLPISNTRAWVVDRALRPVPAGTPGELCLGGDGLARGYLGRPDLTAERFVPNPFGDGERLYRTGDLVRRRQIGEHHGTVEYLGRTDAQVKVRGVRIEPGEIEAVLSHCPRVRSAAVVAREEAEGRRLIAYLVLDEPFFQETSHDVEPFRIFLRDRLPEPMVPSFFVVLDAFPLTPSGKVDRAVLRELAAGLSGPSGAEGASAPRTPVEEIMAGLWAEVLQLDQVGIHDDFFALGGHSLLAGRVLARVRGLLGVELAVQDVFRTPTVAGLARRAEEVRQAEQGIAAPPLRRVSRDAPLRLSFAQERLWLIDQLQPGSTAYNSFLPALLTGPLHEAALAAALAAVVRRHEVLRTHFALSSDIADGPVQVIAPFTSWRLPAADLRGLPEEARSAELRRLIAAEARRPFDLSRGPLFRSCLIRLDAGEQALLLTLHHAVCDGWSLEEVMTAEMSAFYRAALAGTPPPLPSLPVQYADFAQWQRQWLQGAVLDSEIAWWKEHLGGEPPALDLPTDRPRPSAALARAATAGIVLPPPVLEALLGLGRRRGGTLFMVLLAVLQATLHRWSGQDRISVGTPVANRGRVELERLIGFFINTLALCTDLSGDPSAGALLERVRSRALAAFDHQDLPFEKLVAAVQAHRDPSRNPLFQVLFVLQNNRSTGLDLPGLTLSVASPGGGEVVSQFDLSISATEAGGALQLGLAYSLDLFDRPTILRLLSHVQQVAEAFAADPDRPLSEIPLLGIPERRQMEVAAGAAGPAGLSDNARPDAAREEIRQRRDQLASRRRQLSPERQALLHKWVSGAPETKAPERPPLASISPLVPIQPMPEGGGGRPPIFLVHPGNGNVSGYLELAKHLGPEQPLYGLQSPGLSGGDILEGMDVIASRYLEALRAFQPHGPYRLGGWSLGGTFAFEMARRLRREHEEVDALLFIDSHGPEPAGFEPADESILLASLVHDFAGVVGQSFEVSQDDLRRLPAEERLDWILDLARRSNILPESFVSEQARRHWEVFRANVRAVESYVPAAPEELPLRTVLFRATTQPPQAEGRPALGWDAWIAGPLEVVPLEGDHYSLVRDPAVRDLAREIAARLAPEEVGVGR